MKLQKKLYNLAAVENITDRSFNESKRTKDDDISIAKFFQLYDKLFYNIPKVGQLSHSYIINKSNSYAGGIMNNLSQENIDLKNKVDNNNYFDEFYVSSTVEHDYCTLPNLGFSTGSMPTGSAGFGVAG